jgi:hypothetical protein
MSKLTDAYDALRAFVPTVLTDRTELPNPYIIENNASSFLKSGYGVSYGVGDSTNRRANGGYTGAHTFTVTLTAQVTSTENRTDAFVAVKNALYEAAHVLVEAVETNPTLTDAVTNIDWLSFDQIDYLIDENGTDKFIVLPVNFRAIYFQT